MKIATWNVNSVRIRDAHLKTLIKQQDIDILCLQETKAQDEDFPLEALKSLGFPHIVFHGQKSYNGVAILSKTKLELGEKVKLFNDDCRHISAYTSDGIEIHNFYVPAGGYEPDEKINPKYGHKLRYVELMTEWLAKNRKSKDKMILLGDLNIAPLENDVWNHKQMLKVISHTPAETTRFADLYKDLGWVDSARKFVPESEKLYSWWSYRNQDWKKSDRGRRLDHIWVTKPLEKGLKSSVTLRDLRDLASPTDHVPVITEIS